MDTEDVVEDQLCSFFGGWEFWQGNEVSHFGKSVDHGENGGMSIGGR